MNCTRIGVWVDTGTQTSTFSRIHTYCVNAYVCVCLSTYSCVCTCMYTREHLHTYSRCLTASIEYHIAHTHTHEYTTIVSHIYIRIYILYTVHVYVLYVCMFIYVLYICFQLVCAVWVLLLQSHSAPLGSCM